MTPKEKAKELIDKFTFEIGKFNAKQSALVTVNEILSTIVCTPTDYGASWTYWQLVKIEINKL